MAAKQNTDSEKDIHQKFKEGDKHKLYIVQIIGLLLLLLVLMATSVVTVLMVTGSIDVSQQIDGPANSMTDAQFICVKALRAEHSDRMQAFALNDLASSEDGSGGFKMFYDLTMFRGNDNISGVAKFYAECFVSRSGRISHLNVFEEKPYVPKARRRNYGNAFGL